MFFSLVKTVACLDGLGSSSKVVVPGLVGKQFLHRPALAVGGAPVLLCQLHHIAVQTLGPVVLVLTKRLPYKPTVCTQNTVHQTEERKNVFRRIECF